jgi:hypothetical protein
MGINFNKFKREEGEELIKPTHLKKKSIKTISAVEEKVITAKDIIHSLSLKYSGHQYHINNVYLFDGWESDFICFSEEGYLYEIEIKVHRSDFKDDEKLKIAKHALLESNDNKTSRMKPNRFFYAVPRGLLGTAEVPHYAGLIEIDDRNKAAVVVKDAPYLHKENMLNQDMKDLLLKRFYRRYQDMLIKTDGFELE